MVVQRSRNLLRRLVKYVRSGFRSQPEVEREEDGSGIPTIKMLADKDYYLSKRIPMPNSAVIETTTRCNLRCIMCARLDDPRPHGDLPYQVFENCMETLIPNLSRIELQGHGETFLHKRFMDMFERTKKNSSAYVSITTNATLIDESVAERLVQGGMDEILISMDAASSDLYEKIRAGANLEKVLKNIDGINHFRRQYGSEAPRLHIQMVAMKMNIHELPALVKLAADRIGARLVSVIPLAEYSSVKGQSLIRYPEIAKEIVPEAKRLATDKGIELYLAPVIEVLVNGEDDSQDSKEPGDKYEAPSRQMYLNCDDLWRFAFITYKGKVRPCCVSERIMGDLAEFRQEFLSGRPPEECRTCVSRTKFYR
jgi:MoaA/NifB/PqqE/SkfB family radical SAM enzyme